MTGPPQSRKIMTILLVFGRFVASMITLATAMVLARLLAKEDYGLYQQIWLIYNTVAPCLMFGLPASVTYFAPQLDARGQKMVAVQTAALLGIFGLFISLGSYVFAELFGRLYDEQHLPDLVRAFFWYPVFSLPLVFVDALLVATYRARLAAIVSIVSAAAQFAAVVVPVASGAELITVVRILCLFSPIRFVVIAVLVMRFYKGEPFSWDLAFIRRQFSYSLPLSLGQIFGTFMVHLDRLMIALFFTASVYAVYDVGSKELPFVDIISGSVMAIVTPEFVRLYKVGAFQEILRLWHSAIVKVGLLFLPLTAFLLFFATDIIVVLFSERYAESAQIFRIYALLLPLRITNYGALIIAAGRSSLVMKIQAVSLLLNVLLNILFIPTIGLPGAAIARIVSQYSAAACYLYFCSRLLFISLEKVFPLSDLAPILVGSLIPAAVAGFLTANLLPGIVRLLIGFAIFSIPLLILGLTLRRIRGEILDIFRSTARAVGV